MKSTKKMTKTIWRVTALLLIGLTMASCSKKLSPFTERLHKEFDWTEAELQRIQFYLSDDIVLRRKLREEDSRITDGKIRVIDGSEMEEIVFERGTPGVLVFSPKQNRFAISFEEGADDKYLMFGPNAKAGGRYVLLAREWNRRIGQVSYDGKTYSTTSESAYAALLVDLEKARNIHYKSRRAGGRTID